MYNSDNILGELSQMIKMCQI